MCIVCVSPRVLVCGKHSSIADLKIVLGPAQGILAPCAGFCRLWLNGAVSLDACVGTRVRYGE